MGGTLSNESGAIGYGPFVAAGQEGTYSITLAWDAVHLAEAIEFEAMELTRVFQAEFYDQAGHKVRKDVSLALTCAEGPACDSICIDITTNSNHCGSCSGVCEGGYEGGKCAPKYGACINTRSGFESCDAYCASIGETCVEEGCAGSTVLIYGSKNDCEAAEFATPIAEPCGTVQEWSFGGTDIQCCCTDTP